MVAHHPLDVEVVPRPQEPDLYFTPGDLVGELDERWGDRHPARHERGRAKHPDGWDVTLHDTVLRATRAIR